MRHIGSLDDEAQARSLQSYLVTQKVRCMVEEEDGKWTIWIYDEDQVDVGRQELTAFRSAPTNPKYAAAIAKAGRIEKEAQKQAKTSQKRQVNVREQWRRPMMSRTPVTLALIVITMLVCVLTTTLRGQRGGGLMGPQLCNNGWVQYFMISTTNVGFLPEVLAGEFWRLVTPIFVHGSLMHILFNMIWTRDLGSAIEFRRGSMRYLGIVLFCAIVSNLAEYLIIGPRFGGMSGVGFGFFGYIYIKSRYDPGAGLYMSQNLFVLGLFWLLLGFSGIMPIANFAHLFGMLSGGFLAYVPVVLKKLKAN